MSTESPSFAGKAAILPPTPTPYREPLFRQLAERFEIAVIYQSAREPGWDVPGEWFPAEHPYPARHLRSWQRRRPGRTPIVWPRGLERALADADPDCVIVWEYGPASLRALRWCRRGKRGFVVFTECTPQIDRLLPPPQLRLHRWLAKHADRLIVAGSQARARLLAFGVPDGRIELGLQSADLAPFRRAAGPREARKPLTVLTVGRLVPDKNLSMLIEAYARAGLTADEASLEIIGTGFLEQELKQRAQRLGVPARFRGHLAPSELPDVYAEADIYALVSTYEPFGVVIREAAAAGLPIVCSRAAGAVGDVAIDQRNAVLVDPHSVEQIAAALRKLIDDDALRQRLGDESRSIDAESDGRDLAAFAAAIATTAAQRYRSTRDDRPSGTHRP
jgi:glycosyltransferase involved in cell wall biosynthesis